MLRGLHSKLVLIMMLLIVSLMTVVGAFLMNSVVRFYINDFYEQIASVFEDEDFVRDLTQPAAGEENGAEMIDQVLSAYVGNLGVDGRTRNYYVLDGVTGKYLAGSDDEKGASLAVTPNLSTALLGNTGDDSDPVADYIDVAIPIERGDNSYIIYILDNRDTMNNLNNELFSLILDAMVLGLVISVLLSFLLSKTMVDPIQRLTDGAKEIAHGDFSHRIDVPSQDEIGVLTENFNSMAGQLQDSVGELENERNKLDTLFRYMTDGVVAFARSGSVIHSNPAARDLLGCPIDASTDYAPLFGDIASLDEVLASGDGVQGEREVNGRALELLLVPFNRAGQGGILVVIHDVTVQRKNEEMRREFVANVSHELRTPLTNIRSYAETLVDGGTTLPPAMEQQFLGVILSESDRMTHIVQDLLTLSRFDSGHSGLTLAVFPFGAAVRATYDATLMAAQQHGHTMTLSMPDDLPEIVADRERIMQVMMNIVSNSIKYTPDGGTIKISAGSLGDKVWMEVDDNGIGIPQADRGRIFERFYRVDKARSRESGGTGLGLSIAKEIVDRHEGVLKLVDKYEPGLTVRMELKVAGPSHRKEEET